MRLQCNRCTQVSTLVESGKNVGAALLFLTTRLDDHNHCVFIKNAFAYRDLHGGRHMRLAREQSKQVTMQIRSCKSVGFSSAQYPLLSSAVRRSSPRPPSLLAECQKAFEREARFASRASEAYFRCCSSTWQSGRPSATARDSRGSAIRTRHLAGTIRKLLINCFVSLSVALAASVYLMQALVYCNKKCVGKFIHPRLYSVSHLGDASSVSSSDSCPVQQLTIIYDCFKAASSDSSARVSVPVVASSSSEVYQFTVVGRCEGRNFILPATYQFSNQQAAYELQKALYTSRHRQSQAAAAAFVTALSPLITTTDLTLNFGELTKSCCAPFATGILVCTHFRQIIMFMCCRQRS